MCLSRRHESFHRQIFAQFVVRFGLQFEVHHVYVHLVVGIFVEDVEGCPVVAIERQRSIGIIRRKSAARAESVGERIDVEVTFKHPLRMVLALGQSTWRCLSTQTTLCGERCSEFRRNIEGVFEMSGKTVHIFGECPSAIVVETHRNIGGSVFSSARERDAVLCGGS